jgi:hypothetical protein
MWLTWTAADTQHSQTVCMMKHRQQQQQYASDVCGFRRITRVHTETIGCLAGTVQRAYQGHTSLRLRHPAINWNNSCSTIINHTSSIKSALLTVPRVLVDLCVSPAAYTLANPKSATFAVRPYGAVGATHSKILLDFRSPAAKGIQATTAGSVSADHLPGAIAIVNDQSHHRIPYQTGPTFVEACSQTCYKQPAHWPMPC